MRRLAIIAVALALAWPAQAGMLLLGMGAVGHSGGGAYQGVGDAVSGATAYYSCARAYTAALGTSHTQLCNVRNTASTETCDLLAASSGFANVTAMANCSGSSNGVSLATFCTTPCTVVTIYDQTGNSHNVTQATTSHQPALTVSCFTSLPCIQTSTATAQLASGSTFTPASGVVSLFAVGNRTAGTTLSSYFISENGVSNNVLRSASSANKWTLAGTGAINPTSNDSTWHAGIGIINGSSSYADIDGVSTNGTITGITTAGSILVGGQAAATIEEVESGFYDNTALTSSPQAAVLCENLQNAYGGGSNFGATC